MMNIKFLTTLHFARFSAFRLLSTPQFLASVDPSDVVSEPQRAQRGTKEKMANAIFSIYTLWFFVLFVVNKNVVVKSYKANTLGFNPLSRGGKCTMPSVWQTRLGGVRYIPSILFIVFLLFASCNKQLSPATKTKSITAEHILGNPNYQAICYGGFRAKTREVLPTLAQIKEDMLILSAMKIKIIRTYNVHFDDTKNLLQVISEMKKENPDFEMYVMLGAWIDCKNAWTTEQTHIRDQDSERNATEIAEAVRLANQYPDIVKIISVGNEAMVHWAYHYHVTPGIILKWVNHLQQLKKENKLHPDIWITSSDNYASWGGGDAAYHKADLTQLFKAVDYVSIHIYPMHETHYFPNFWGVLPNETALPEEVQIDSLMSRARDYGLNQFRSVKKYMHSLGVQKPIHIGETGWASSSDGFYGLEGTKACDEYKSSKFYTLMRAWSDTEKITCFYFEAFDEIWKDKDNPRGSENHFGLFTIDGKAKYMLWNEVDKGTFNNRTRDGKAIEKTHNGDKKLLWKDLKIPLSKN
jgi:exo-beta-1,3-glucanase (GH17 family)